MAQTFHSFLLLPWELRNQIWEHALRPDRPGAHIFRISTRPRLYDKEGKRILDVSEVVVSTTSLCHRLSAPNPPLSHTVTQNQTDGGVDDGTAPLPISWFNNPSTYLIDGGLWMACKESRLVMERRFKTREWKTILKERRRPYGCGMTYNPIWSPNEDDLMPQESLPVSGYFNPDKRSASDVRFFTVLPHNDLIVLQPEGDDSFREMWDWYIPIDTQRLGFGGIRDVAVEYDPAWDNDGDKWDPIVWIIGEAAAALYNQVTTIWFIDRRLQRDPGRL
ncbi:hypothetical protein CONLIGDRAFT_648945 [Coniochaeta ligniaria NRRL 30616]|uniref:2EXR domain-containing protein n=1 Tax=Coniochaeta ligniaria NRRL 30616 TaxID=1408157 RepID=A0A1J7I922_9PEZI|nr:hypothetical protein CONLIGDRAFT_648945 [Coniochaeta ligniaria NRRL 30616]